jgi:hypothetical protein
MTLMEADVALPKRAYSVAQVAEMYSMSRSAVLRLVNKGTLANINFGRGKHRLIRIPRWSIMEVFETSTPAMAPCEKREAKKHPMGEGREEPFTPLKSSEPSPVEEARPPVGAALTPLVREQGGAAE